jgi:hypothetical protein
MRSFLTILESLTFSLLFHWAYSASEFKSRADRYMQDQRAPRLGTWRAIRDAVDLSDIANAVWVALGLAWRSLVCWRTGSGSNNGTNKGPLGMAIGMIVAAAGKRETTKRGRGVGQGLSPFDDSMAATEPAMPGPARASSSGRTRTFNGRDDLGMPMAHHAQRTEYASLRGDDSRESSLSDRSYGR